MFCLRCGGRGLCVGLHKIEDPCKGCQGSGQVGQYEIIKTASHPLNDNKSYYIQCNVPLSPILFEEICREVSFQGLPSLESHIKDLFLWVEHLPFLASLPDIEEAMVSFHGSPSKEGSVDLKSSGLLTLRNKVKQDSLGLSPFLYLYTKASSISDAIEEASFYIENTIGFQVEREWSQLHASNDLPGSFYSYLVFPTRETN